MLLSNYSYNKSGFRVYEKGGVRRLYMPKELIGKRVDVSEKWEVVECQGGVPVNRQAFVSLNRLDNEKWEELKSNVNELKIK